MKLSIVIVNYRSWDHLRNALEGLHTDFPDDWEVIVVDNESESDAFEQFAAQYTWVKMIANPVNSGFGPGCMIGVAEATGEQLLFMNPDVIASVEEIRQLAAIKRNNPDIGLLAPKQVGTDGKPQKVFDEFPDTLNQSKILKAIRRLILPKRHPDPRAVHDELVWCDWVTGSMLLINKADFDRIGGWSLDYWMYVEDADLCRRAHNAGLRVAYTPEVVVVHAHGGSSRINVAVKSMTKLEVIISKHVYTSKHASAPSRALTHLMIALLRLPALIAAWALDLLTLRRIPALRVRSNMLKGTAQLLCAGPEKTHLGEPESKTQSGVIRIQPLTIAAIHHVSPPLLIVDHPPDRLIEPRIKILHRRIT